MALRNLGRHKVKTIITVMAVMVSVAMFIFMDGWISGMSVESRRNIVNYEIGAAKLQAKLYFEKKDDLPGYENYNNWETYRDILDDAGYNAAPRFVFLGTLYTPGGSAPMLFNAVDPAAEAKVLRYTSYMESGRYIQSGAIELVLGTMAAEKLNVGIPQRPRRKELTELMNSLAISQTEKDFIHSLYEPAGSKGEGFGAFNIAEKPQTGNERMLLKKNISRADMERYWNMLAETGRNDVQISAVIDVKAAPEKIRNDKWDGELMPALGTGDQELIKAIYQYEDFLDSYLLNENTDDAMLSRVLEIMIRSDFSGAVRHINQLIPAIVVGVINSPDPVTNANTAYIPLDVLQGEEGMMLEGRITELLIRDKNGKEAELPGKRESVGTITAVLNKGLESRGKTLPEELAVFTWIDYVQDYLGYESLENGATKILSILLFVLAFLGISNTILLAIMERTKEIGMMRALGMTDSQMVTVYMLEAGFLGFIGSLLGVALGCLLNIPMVEYGMDISAMSEAMGGSVGFRVASRFRSMWN
ncbi:MAG: FtsX-like permease family protein, partial [Treponema sp.]|nr:FtsX-like permease family protein [Treponema sp.]